MIETIKMRAMVLGIIALASCSKLEELAPQYEEIPKRNELHVYYDSATYFVEVDGKRFAAGDSTKQGVDVYPIKDRMAINFSITKGKRTAVTFRAPTWKHEYGYVRAIRNGLESKF